MENSKKDGYITEKMFNAFLSGAIPIWYGTKGIFEMFNQDAFIYYDIESPGLALSRVQSLESNRTAYEEMLREPILANGTATIEKWFSLGDEIGGGKMKNRVLALMGYRIKLASTY